MNDDSLNPIVYNGRKTSASVLNIPATKTNFSTRIDDDYGGLLSKELQTVTAFRQVIIGRKSCKVFIRIITPAP